MKKYMIFLIIKDRSNIMLCFRLFLDNKYILNSSLNKLPVNCRLFFFYQASKHILRYMCVQLHKNYIFKWTAVFSVEKYRDRNKLCPISRKPYNFTWSFYHVLFCIWLINPLYTDGTHKYHEKKLFIKFI